MEKFNGFMWAAPQIVGNATKWDYSYTCSSETYKTLKQAFKAGWKELGHDDFIIAQWKDDKVIAVYAGAEKSDKRDDLLEDYGDGIMREYGLAA